MPGARKSPDGERGVYRENWKNSVYSIVRITRPIYPTRTIEKCVPNNAVKSFIIQYEQFEVLMAYFIFKVNGPISLPTHHVILTFLIPTSCNWWLKWRFLYVYVSHLQILLYPETLNEHACTSEARETNCAWFVAVSFVKRISTEGKERHKTYCSYTWSLNIWKGLWKF
jgi:hypothetical protein